MEKHKWHKKNQEEDDDFIFHNKCTNEYKYICDKYNVEGYQKSLCHPSWPPTVTNITDNGEERTEKKQNREIMIRKPTQSILYASATYNITPTHNCCDVIYSTGCFTLEFVVTSHYNILKNIHFVLELLIFGIAYQITWWRLIL